MREIDDDEAGGCCGSSGAARGRWPSRFPAELADFLVAEGVVDDVSHEGLRILLREKASLFNA